MVPAAHEAGGPTTEQGLVEMAEAAEVAAIRDPRNVSALLRAAEAWLAAGSYERAGLAASAAVKAAPDDYMAVRTLSGILGVTGRTDLAVRAALAAVALQPSNGETRLHLGGLYAGQGKWKDAAEQLARHVSLPGTVPVGWRLLSTALHQIGRTDRAIEAIRHARAMDTSDIEYTLHLASLLAARGRYGDALVELEGAAAAAPSDARIWRATSGIYEVLGDLATALVDAEKAARMAPGDEAIVGHLEHVASMQGLPIPGRDVAAEAATWTERRPRRVRIPRHRPRGIFAALGTRGRIIHAIMLREMRTKFGRTNLGYVWALAEPISHLLTLGMVFSILNHAPPPIGDSLFLFYLTGLLPYLMFSHVSNEVTSSLAANGAVLQLPIVRRTDVMVARATLHLSTEAVVGIIVFGTAALLGERGMPADPLGALAAILSLWGLAVGIGAINMLVTEMFPSWDTFYQAIVRVLYFASGIYYSPIVMPGVIREILAWNPVLQGIEWFRSGFFGSYEPHWLDRGYLLECAFGALLIGFAGERALRRSIRVAP